MAKTFISYSRKDKEFVDRLVRDVETDDVDVWVDRTDIRGGDGWVSAIGRAIRECSSFLLVLSPSSSNSKTVARELCLADEYGKQIIPLRLQQCEASENIELLLAGRQWVDFEDDYAEGLRRLLVALGGQPPPEPQRPKPQPPAQSPPQGSQGQMPSAGNQGAWGSQPHVPQHPIQPQHPPQLWEVLPGNWIATVIYPMMPPLNVPVSLAPGGFFTAFLPTGSRAQGNWSVQNGNQIYMQGVETNGLMTAPYVAVMAVTNYNQVQINGVGPRGEPVVWRRTA